MDLEGKQTPYVCNSAVVGLTGLIISSVGWILAGVLGLRAHTRFARGQWGPNILGPIYMAEWVAEGTRARFHRGPNTVELVSRGCWVNALGSRPICRLKKKIVVTQDWMYSICLVIA